MLDTFFLVSDDDEKHSRRRDFRGKKDKRDKKDRGYRMFEEEDSEEELFLSEDVKYVPVLFLVRFVVYWPSNG